MNKNNKIIKLAVFITISGLAINIIWNKFLKPKEFISPISKNAQIASPVKQTNSPSLENIIDKSLKGAKGTYAIAIKNLRNGENYYLDAHKSFTAGSLYKLWVMAETFRQLAQGTLKEDEILTAKIQDLNREFDIDSDYRELTSGTITLNIKDALNQMITISHNYAALLLTKKLGLDNIKVFLTNYEFKESDLDTSPNTTAADIAIFFEKLYKGELASSENTQKMIDLLKKQTINDKLPRNLPTGTVIAHKTGEIDFFTHDAGIVFTKNDDYIIVVLSESDSPKGAEDRIAQVSLAVYKYFTSK